ncbi:hypothetical protein HDU97_000704 [Phlyctochytrium planicorne]|nr:hypothetical protein HDU97_000704 [Phlyctochytrium planicorne]
MSVISTVSEETSAAAVPSATATLLGLSTPSLTPSQPALYPTLSSTTTVTIHPDDFDDSDSDESDLRSMQPKEPPTLPASLLLFQNNSSSNGFNHGASKPDVNAPSALASIVKFPLNDISDDEEVDGHDDFRQLKVSVMVLDEEDDESSWSAHLSRSSSNSRLNEMSWVAAYEGMAGSSNQPQPQSVTVPTSSLQQHLNGHLESKGQHPSEGILQSGTLNASNTTINALNQNSHAVGGIPMEKSLSQHSLRQFTVDSSSEPNNNSTTTAYTSATHFATPPIMSVRSRSPEWSTTSQTSLQVEQDPLGSKSRMSSPMSNNSIMPKSSGIAPPTVSNAVAVSSTSLMNSPVSTPSSTSLSSLASATITSSQHYHLHHHQDVPPRTLTKMEIKKIHRTSTVSQRSQRDGAGGGLDCEDRLLVAVMGRLELLEFLEWVDERDAILNAGVANNSKRGVFWGSRAGVATIPNNSGKATEYSNPLTPPDSPNLMASTKVSPLPAKMIPSNSSGSLSPSSLSSSVGSPSTSPSSGSAFSFLSGMFSRAFGSSNSSSYASVSNRTALGGPTLSRGNPPSRDGSRRVTVSGGISGMFSLSGKNNLSGSAGSGMGGRSNTVSTVMRGGGGGGVGVQIMDGRSLSVGGVASGSRVEEADKFVALKGVYADYLPRMPKCRNEVRERLLQGCRLFELGGMEVAAATFGRAMTGGDPLARFAWAMCLLNGFGVAMNEKMALEHLRVSAHDGEVLAMFELGNYYRFGHGGHSGDDDEGIEEEDEDDEDYIRGGSTMGSSLGGKRSLSSMVSADRRSMFDVAVEDASESTITRKRGPVPPPRPAGSLHQRTSVASVASLVGGGSSSTIGERNRQRRLSSATAPAGMIRPISMSSSTSGVPFVPVDVAATTTLPIVRGMKEQERRRWMVGWYIAGAECGHAESRVAAAECLLSAGGASRGDGEEIRKGERRLAAEFLRLAGEQQGFERGALSSEMAAWRTARNGQPGYAGLARRSWGAGTGDVLFADALSQPVPKKPAAPPRPLASTIKKSGSTFGKSVPQPAGSGDVGLAAARAAESLNGEGLSRVMEAAVERDGGVFLRRRSKSDILA